MKVFSVLLALTFMVSACATTTPVAYGPQAPGITASQMMPAPPPGDYEGCQALAARMYPDPAQTGVERGVIAGLLAGGVSAGVAALVGPSVGLKAGKAAVYVGTITGASTAVTYGYGTFASLSDARNAIYTWCVEYGGREALRRAGTFRPTGP